MLVKFMKNDKLTKEEKKTIKKNEDLKKKTSSLWNDFKAFITRGNILDLAVGVIIGGAFNSIVTAFTKILMSICTWGVPGGIDGLVTVLPAINAGQSGSDFAGQFIQVIDVSSKVIDYASRNGVTLTIDSPLYNSWEEKLLKNYTLHGTTYTFNGSNVIDWGTFINAIITFLIISITLFVIVKVFKYLSNKRQAYEKALAEKKHQDYLKQHPEELEKELKAKEEANKPVPKPENTILLNEIKEELKKLNSLKEVNKIE